MSRDQIPGWPTSRIGQHSPKIETKVIIKITEAFATISKCVQSNNKIILKMESCFYARIQGEYITTIFDAAWCALTFVILMSIGNRQLCHLSRESRKGPCYESQWVPWCTFEIFLFTVHICCLFSHSREDFILCKQPVSRVCANFLLFGLGPRPASGRIIPDNPKVTRHTRQIWWNLLRSGEIFRLFFSINMFKFLQKYKYVW